MYIVAIMTTTSAQGQLNLQLRYHVVFILAAATITLLGLEITCQGVETSTGENT